MDPFLGPAHLRDVDQAFHSPLQFHKGAVVGDRDHVSHHDGSDGIFLLDVVPGIGKDLFEAKRDLFGFAVEFEDLDRESVADLDDLGGMVDPSVGHVGDVEESVNAAQVEERAIFGDVLDHTLHHHVLFQVGKGFGTFFGYFLFH
jgi:hypothetical protein